MKGGDKSIRPLIARRLGNPVKKAVWRFSNNNTDSGAPRIMPIFRAKAFRPVNNPNLIGADALMTLLLLEIETSRANTQ
jgi:hypothetical protein